MSSDLNEDKILDSLWPLMVRRMTERANAAVDLIDELLRATGPIHRRDQDLLAGQRVLNDDRELLPRVARATSLGISLYLGNRRIASFSVLDAGSTHAVGGFAEARLADIVLRKRETFRGSLDVNGREHIVACRPLLATGVSKDYGALGMIEAYQDVRGLRDLVETTVREGLDGGS